MTENSKTPPQNWQLVQSDYAADHRIFKTRIDQRRSPRSGEVHRFVVLDTPDWINVVALTQEGKVILVRQFRHGLESLCLEIPGGMVDAGEEAEVAARRELLEETGYFAQSWERIGVVHPNPAFQNNRCTTFLARGCELVGPTHFDATEDISVELVDPEELPELVASGLITHSLVIAGLYWYLYETRRGR